MFDMLLSKQLIKKQRALFVRFGYHYPHYNERNILLALPQELFHHWEDQVVVAQLGVAVRPILHAIADVDPTTVAL